MNYFGIQDELERKRVAAWDGRQKEDSKQSFWRARADGDDATIDEWSRRDFLGETELLCALARRVLQLEEALKRVAKDAHDLGIAAFNAR